MLRRTENKNIEISFTMELTAEGVEMFQDLVGNFPNFCPSCKFTHDSKLWVRNKQDVFECANCKYILQDSDLWHSVIE